MNTPTPDFISRIAASSQTIASIEEHNSVNSSTNFYPVSASPRVSTNSAGLNATNADLHCEYHPSEVSSSASWSSHGAANSQGVTNPGLWGSTSLPNPTTDLKGLSSVLEAELSSQVVVGDRFSSETGPVLRTLITAEELGSVENLLLWLGERLSSSVLSRWGTEPGTKRVSNLWSELVEGESTLEDSKPPKRTTQIARVKIKNEEGLALIESFQDTSEGEMRVRNRALSEKMKPGENVEDACLRGIFEELGSVLGASERVTMVPESYTKEEEERDSLSYPGLPTLFIIHSMEAQIRQLPSTEFCTDESESDHGSPIRNGDAQPTAVFVKRHFWKWVPESDLAELG